ARDLVLLQVRVEHVPARAVEHAVLVERVGDPLEDAAVYLALDRERVHGPPAVVHGDDALDFHDAGLDVDGDLGELHAAQRLGHAPAALRAVIRGAARALGHLLRLHAPAPLL